MLQLSNRTFNEKNLGFESFGKFLEAQRDLVTIDLSQRPPTVKLTGQAKVEVLRNTPPAPRRIRPDLWQAMIDYSSGATYVWDSDAHVARRRKLAEDTNSVLPTITRADLDALSERFFATHYDSSNEDERRTLIHWKESKLSTSALPKRLQGPWNQALKELVRGALVAWFEAKGMVQPPDLEGLTKLRSTHQDGLRVWIHRVIDAMSEEELSSLLLPAAATHRASRPE